MHGTVAKGKARGTRAFMERSVGRDVHATIKREDGNAVGPRTEGYAATVGEFERQLVEALVVEEWLQEVAAVGDDTVMEHRMPKVF